MVLSTCALPSRVWERYTTAHVRETLLKEARTCKEYIVLYRLAHASALDLLDCSAADYDPLQSRY